MLAFKIFDSNKYKVRYSKVIEQILNLKYVGNFRLRRTKLVATICFDAAFEIFVDALSNITIVILISYFL